MSGPAVQALDLEGGLSVLSAQLTKVKSLKTKKLNAWRKTIERFKVDQNNQELWSALKLDRETAEDFGTAYEVLMEVCMGKMQEELDRAESGTVSPIVAKLAVAKAELASYMEDKEALESSFYELAGSFHERRNADNSLVTEKDEMDAMDLDGGINVLSAQLTKVRSLKTKKLNTLRRTLERFKVDQNNLELWSALKLNREAAEESGTAYEVLMEVYMARMQEELDGAELGIDSPMTAKMAIAATELGVYEGDTEALESSFYDLAGSFHERRNAENSLEKSRAELQPSTKTIKAADAIRPPVASLRLSPTEFQIWAAPPM
jgi:hypothetical protein